MKTQKNQLHIKLPIHLQDEKVAYTLLDHFVQNRTTYTGFPDQFYMDSVNIQKHICGGGYCGVVWCGVVW